MKYVSLFFVAAFLFVFTSCQNSTATEGAGAPIVEVNPIVGAWELLDTETGETIQIKIFSESHFATVWTANGASSTGTYRLEGNEFIETHLYGSHEEGIKRAPVTMSWTYEVKGDSLFMSGPLSCSDRDGKNLDDLFEMCAEGNSISETRVRAKK